MARAGKSIARVFEEEGESAFRALERETVRELCAGEGRIIACGGGAFIDPQNQDRMLSGGMVVCLSARPETVYKRVTAESGGDAPVRPLLAGGNPLERIRDLMSQRAETYSQAHYTIETDDLTPEEVALEVLAICRRDSP